MSTKLYLKCPGNDPVSRAVPELFICTFCGMEIEIWTDEIKGRCISCNRVFRKYKTDISAEKSLSNKICLQRLKN